MSKTQDKRRKIVNNSHSFTLPQKTAIAIATAMAFSSYVQISNAAQFTVSNLNATGTGSLNTAIGLANEASGADEIIFQPGLSGTIVTSSTNLLPISDALTITGPGKDVVTVTTNNDCESSCNDLFTVTSSGTVTIKGLTLNKSNINNQASLIEHSGAGDLIIEDSDLLNTGNGTTTGNGGGINNSGGNLTVRNSTISGQIATDGGAIAMTTTAGSTFALENSTINDNSVTGGDGGGLYLTETAAANISDSLIDNNSSDNNGGGIYYNPNAAGQVPLVIENSTISHNTAVNGGGLNAELSGSDNVALTINNTAFTANEAINSGSTSASGGGAYIAGGTSVDLSISNSTFNSNTVTTGGTGSTFGGALSIDTSNGDLTIESSSFNNNSVATNGGSNVGFGAGLFISVVSNPIQISNTTISGNNNFGVNGPVAPPSGPFGPPGGTALVSSGGGIYLSSTSASSLNAQFLNTTIYNNQVNSGQGGGIFTDGSSTTLTIVNSIVAANTALTGPDITGTDGTVSIDYSLVGDDTDVTLTEISMSNIIGDNTAAANPSLNDLANNGGNLAGVDSDIPLLTHSIKDGSQVISAGDQSATNSSITLPNTDQRGTGFDRIFDGGIDLGAIEYRNVSPQLDSAITDLTVSLNDVINVDLSQFFSDPENAALNFTSSDAPTNLSLASNGMLTGTITEAIFNSLPATVNLTVSDGNTSITKSFTINQASDNSGTTNTTDTTDSGSNTTGGGGGSAGAVFILSLLPLLGLRRRK